MYFKVEMERRFPAQDKVLGHPNGEFVTDGEKYFAGIGKGEIIKGAPVFNYFYLQSFGPEEEWEWKLQDLHGFIGQGSKMGSNWFVSENFKILLDNFKIAPDYQFYESILSYRKNKLKYWVFQFTASYRKLNKMKYVDFQKTEFISKNNDSYAFNSYEEYSQKNEEIYEQYGEDLKVKNLVMNQFFDFIVLNPLNSDIIVSEDLKNAIVKMKLEGFIFSSLDYEIALSV